MTIKTYTPACIASWESTLSSRTELCLSIAGTNRSKLTLYAGPDAAGSAPIAILTGLDNGIYVSRPQAPNDIQQWISAMLQAAEELNLPAKSAAGSPL
ncbi:hypothetical protein [Pseudarthrobacter sp. NamB4]|uniref:hypothetical protein n=1 Tax=Pseudarthrobacter sp. NamB4 TaxID=2576837 RepID=UPI0010FE47DF|nr:hypothetical protein [Pseudarthrobacter sp. NamB4]TLM70895.1 hypothetical protein FDW81_17095 [Pseudarthrobacter sp. NamB4]